MEVVFPSATSANNILHSAICERSPLAHPNSWIKESGRPELQLFDFKVVAEGNMAMAWLNPDLSPEKDWYRRAYYQLEMA
jgi:hypothetical protein